MDYKKINENEIKKIKKNDIRKWLLGENARLYIILLLVFLAAVIVIFTTVNQETTKEGNVNNEESQETIKQEETQPEDTTKYNSLDRIYEIRVNKKNNFMTILKTDNEGNYTIVDRVFICSVSESAKIGTTKISDKSIWKKQPDNRYGHFASRMEDSGVISSVSFYSDNNSNIVAKSYNDLGKPAETGYIVLTTQDAKWIYENCGKETVVVVYDDVNETPALSISSPSKISNGYRYDPTDEDCPVYNNKSTTKIKSLSGVKDCTIKKGTAFNKLEGISARDVNEKSILENVVITGNLDTNTSGTYTLIYYLSDCFGTNIAYYRYVTVTD